MNDIIIYIIYIRILTFQLTDTMVFEVFATSALRTA